MDEKLVFLTICGMGAVTFLPRLLPMLLLSGRNLSYKVVFKLFETLSCVV